MTIDKKMISERIQRIMQTANLTQKDLAALLDISQPAISHYLQGRMPPPDVLWHIARIGNTTMEWLLTGDNRDAPAPLQVREATAQYGQQSVLLSLWDELPKDIRQDLIALMRHIVKGNGVVRE